MPLSPNLATSPRRSSSAGAGAATGAAAAAAAAAHHASPLTQHMAQSMTIDEMRALHQRALTDADAKRTELRLVLASRYRELVGSSDEVIKMKERAQELHDVVQALPELIAKLSLSASPHQPPRIVEEEKNDADAANEAGTTSTVALRRELSWLPRQIYRALDTQDVHRATVALLRLFTLVASQTNAYPLANALATVPTASSLTPTPPQSELLDPVLEAQLRTTFLQVQTLPDKVRRLARGVLARSASYGGPDPALGAQRSAAALASLHGLGTDGPGEDAAAAAAERLLTTYFEAKAKLLVTLLNQLTSSLEQAVNAEEILSKIVLILQHDIVLHPYQIFVLRTFPDSDRIMPTLPLFDKDAAKAKCSKYVRRPRHFR